MSILSVEIHDPTTNNSFKKCCLERGEWIPSHKMIFICRHEWQLALQLSLKLENIVLSPS